MHYCRIVFFKMSIKINSFLHSGRIDVIGLKVTTV